MSNVARAHKSLLKRILEGDGQAPRAQRRAAFDNARLTGPLTKLVDKVARHADQVTDSDVDEVKAAGISEDQSFEIVVCAAIGQATRQYEAALAALVEATEKP